MCCGGTHVPPGAFGGQLPERRGNHTVKEVACKCEEGGSGFDCPVVTPQRGRGGRWGPEDQPSEVRALILPHILSVEQAGEKDLEAHSQTTVNPPSAYS